MEGKGQFHNQIYSRKYEPDAVREHAIASRGKESIHEDALLLPADVYYKLGDKYPKPEEKFKNLVRQRFKITEK